MYEETTVSLDPRYNFSFMNELRKVVIKLKKLIQSVQKIFHKIPYRIEIFWPIFYSPVYFLKTLAYNIVFFKLHLLKIILLQLRMQL